MSIEAIQTHKKSGLGNGILASAIGAGAGYAAKYALPLTAQEKDADYQKMIKLISEKTRQAQKDFMDAVKDIKPLAQDVYVKNMRNLEKSNVRAYDRALKRIRPTSPFVVVGAAAGLVTSFIKSTISTDI